MTEPRWQRRRDARPAELLDAAAYCFGTSGYRAARVEDIAARAGVTVGTIYRYYPNKDALFAAVLDECRKQLPSGWAVAERDPGRLLRETIDRWWAFLGDQGQAMLLRAALANPETVPEAASGYAAEVRRRMEQQLGGVLRLGMATSAFRTLDVAGVARALADVLLGGGLTRTPAAGPTEDSTYLTAVFTTLIHGIVNRAPVAAPDRPAAPAGDSPAGAIARTDSW